MIKYFEWQLLRRKLCNEGNIHRHHSPTSNVISEEKTVLCCLNRGASQNSKVERLIGNLGRYWNDIEVILVRNIEVNDIGKTNTQ